MKRRLPLAAGLALTACLLLAGCGSSDQSTLNPAGEPARRITSLWWIMMIVSWVGFGFIVFLLGLGWLHRKRPHLPFVRDDRVATRMVVVLGIGVPILILSALFAYSNFFVIRSTEAPLVSSTSMTIHVIGHQWFWEVRYPGTTAVTANEIHIPVHTRVNLIVTTADVIHSFWAPELNRKIDTIPGQRNRILLEADRTGIFRGQCAEFCGLQHANMGLAVYVQPVPAFRAWLANMARPARAPTTAEERLGRDAFLSNACAACHTIRGTTATGGIGPDLTHLATRDTLAALTVPNNPGNLAGWIVDPQHIKPGNKMPGLDLPPQSFQALTVYLESLR